MALLDGRTVVTTHGTRVKLSTTPASVKWVSVTAPKENTDLVVLGGAAVVAAAGTRKGHELSPGACISFPADDLTDIFIDSLVDGEGVTWVAGDIGSPPPLAGANATVAVSGTLTENLTKLGGTNIDTNSGVKSAGTQRVVLATDQPALTNPLDQNLKQIAGGAIDTNSGVKSAGTQRVVLATDQPALSTPLPVDTELPAAVVASDALTNPTAPQVLAHLMAWDGFNSQWKRLGVGTGFGDTITGGNAIAVLPYLFGGSTWDRPRNPTIFKSFASTAITAGTGATIWTPAAGKKFRLMGFMISSSVAGVLIFGDNVVGTVIARSAAVAAAGIAQLGAGDMGNGILSAAANNVLKIDGPTGNVAGMVWGTEE